jgi:hypothetical protein
LLTLIVTPVAYSLFDDLGASTAWRALASRVRIATAPLARRLEPILFWRKRRPEPPKPKVAPVVEGSREEDKEEVEVGVGD